MSRGLGDVYKRQGFYREPMEKTYQSYLDARAEIFKDRPDKFVCLMDLALMAMKKLKAEGKLADQETYTDASDRRPQARLTQEAKIASDFFGQYPVQRTGK